MSKKKITIKNIYHTVVPTKFKRKKYMDGLSVFENTMIEILKIFIEKECNNGKTQYHPRLSVKEREKIVTDIKENYYSYAPREEVLIKEYRGLSYGCSYVSLDFLELVDLYYWFEFEEKDWFDDVKNDFSLGRQVPDGETQYVFKKSHKINGGSEIVFNKNRKYPDYKRKYTYHGLPENYLIEIRKKKFMKLVSLYPSLWT